MKELTILIGLAIFFAPTILAFKNKKDNIKSIAALNILLGWSLIAYVIAIIWATRVDGVPKLKNKRIKF